MDGESLYYQIIDFIHGKGFDGIGDDADELIADAARIIAGE